MAAPFGPRRVRGGRKVYTRPQPVGHHAAADVDVTLTALGGRGDGLGRLPSGEVVLVSGGVPGERWRVRLLAPGRGPRRGEAITLLEPSSARVAAPCPVFARCGGCDLQHIDAAVQSDQKRAWVQRLLLPGDPALDWRIAVAPFGYRRRVRFHLRRTAGRLAAGFLARGSEHLAATTACLVLVPALDRLLASLPPELDAFVDSGEVHATAGAEGVVVRIDAAPRAHGAALPPGFAATLAARLGLRGVALRSGRLSLHAGLAEVTLGETVLPLAPAGPTLPVRVDAAGFSQATELGNVAIRAAVVEAVAALGPLPRAQEFFAGSGNLTAVLVGRVAELCTVEADAAAVRRSRHLVAAAAPLGTSIDARCGDAASLAQPPGADELWLLDPGRPGAAELCQQAAKCRPRHVVYVSCALDTLGRDLRTLRAAGYLIRSAVGIDSLPQTVHVEVVVRLEHPGVGAPTTPGCATSSP
ncbi:MAG: class I SAM-dependent RNA methyltransferase [Myxococcales bacterium]|nr:class I SAM-dependent RNA methyltransferase [Myxococcales bacterium]